MNDNSNGNKNKRNVQEKKKEPLKSPYSIDQHIHFESIDSTNTWAKNHWNQWSPTGITLISAATQTAGRGRFKRRWESPPDVNIYATFCFWIDHQRTDIGHIPQLLALSVVQAIEKQGLFPKIKWPNDVLIAGKKVAGILCETVLEKEQRGVICGIGLNINMAAEILNQIDRPATSLMVESGHFHQVDIVFDDLKSIFTTQLVQFLQEGFLPFFPQYQKYSFFKKGQMVRFHNNQYIVEAQFEKLNPEGSIELLLPDGKIRIFHAGEFLE